MFKISILLISLLHVSQLCETYKVLVIFPLQRKSHEILGDGVVRHLLDAGHKVTYVTPFLNNRKQHSFLREVHVKILEKIPISDNRNIEKQMNGDVNLSSITTLLNLFLDINVALFEDSNFVALLNDQNEQFDIVIAEWMFNELFSGVAAVFNCPYIWVSTFLPHWMVLKLIDEIPNPAYNADAMFGAVAPFTTVQRVKKFINVAFGLTLQYFYVSSVEHKEYKRLIMPFIQKRGHKVPNFEELRYNASLILGNYHASVGNCISLPQNYKAIGGYHIATNIQPLPEDLKKILDNARNGLIYFSMGSILRGKSMPLELRIGLMKMFGKLNQTVIWKIEENPPCTPSNVHVVRWAPQQSILAHPNCVLFITHGGLLSITESVHFAKPIIGIPVFADQFNNINNAVKKGFGKKVDLSYNMIDNLEMAILDILSDSSYSATVKTLSSVYHDRPLPPGKELVHWVEHVVRTRGAPHLRSPALLLSWYQKCYLDFIALIIAILYIVKFIVKTSFYLFSFNQHKMKTY